MGGTSKPEWLLVQMSSVGKKTPISNPVSHDISCPTSHEKDHFKKLHVFMTVKKPDKVFSDTQKWNIF